MDYCGPRGIPHSHFLGGPVEWTTPDREKALAWAAQKRRTHDRCGTRTEEWDPEQGGDRNAWEYVEQVCPGCARLEAAEAQMRQDADDMRGVHLVLRRPTRKPT